MSGRKTWVIWWWLDLARAVQEPFLLHELQSAIRASSKRIDAASPEEEEWVVDSECEVIETVLGMSFIACQLDISSVLSRCLKLHKFVPKLGPPPRKLELMTKSNPLVGGTVHSQVAAIDGFANYFKHEDEWPGDWKLDPKKDRGFATAEMVKALGAEPGSSGNMRTGFEAIVGHSWYERVSELREIVLNWARKLKTEYEEEMRRKKLLPEG